MIRGFLAIVVGPGSCAGLVPVRPSRARLHRPGHRVANGRAAWLTAAFVVAAAGCGPAGGFLVTPVSGDRTLEEWEVARDAGLLIPDKIALVDVDGLLVNKPRDGLLREGEHPVALLAEKLEKAAADRAVKAVVLRINSPGGTVTASQLMHQQVQAFKLRTGRPVVAMMMDVAASGGYYVACAADEIIACPSTVTGSIGVMMQWFEASGTLEKIGVTTDAIVSGPRKDSGSPLRRMRPEEREHFQKIVNQMYDQFVAAVCAGRPRLSESRVRELADGRVFLAPEAVQVGLVDRLGTLADAVAAAKQRANLRRARVVRYARPMGWTPNWYAGPSRPAETSFSLIRIDADSLLSSGPAFLYLLHIGPFTPVE